MCCRGRKMRTSKRMFTPSCNSSWWRLLSVVVYVVQHASSKPVEHSLHSKCIFDKSLLFFQRTAVHCQAPPHNSFDVWFIIQTKKLLVNFPTGTKKNDFGGRTRLLCHALSENCHSHWNGLQPMKNMVAARHVTTTSSRSPKLYDLCQWLKSLHLCKRIVGSLQNWQGSLGVKLLEDQIYLEAQSKERGQ